MKALITLLTLGVSSAAVAQPSTVAPYAYDHRYTQPPVQAPPAPAYRFNHDRYEDRFDGDDGFHGEYRFERRMRFRRPVLLAQGVLLERQWNDHQQQVPKLIELDTRVGGLKRLQITTAGGRTYLDTVVVHFADGRIQTVRPNQMLSFRQPSVTVDLEHGVVASMYLYATPTRGRASVDVIGLRR